MYSWATEERTHEGFPLYLRRATDVDTIPHRKSFPNLAVITHKFTARYPDGRPDPDYNHALADFDHDIVTAFDALHSGVPVLVETFGGERTYYFCVSPQTDVSAIVSSIDALYPREQLTWELRPERGWSFLDQYAKDFFQCA